MAYTLNTATGVVTRDTDGVQVAPTSEPASQAYLDWLAWCGAGGTPATISVPELDEAAYEKACIDAVQAHLDATAQGLGYDGILSAVSYAPSTHPKFGPEGRAMLAYRDTCWTQSFTTRAAVLAGQRSMPTPEQLVAELPPFSLG